MILVTGGAGVIGTRLAFGLLARNQKVRILALPGDPAVEKFKGTGIEVRYGDITRPETMAGLADNVDTVYHLAALILSPGRPEQFSRINTEGTRNLVRLSEEAGSSHFIFVSSASVTYGRSNPYSRSKLEAETAVRTSRLPHYTIVRPTLAYEEGGAEEFMKFAGYLKRFPVVPFIGQGRALKSPVHVEDIIQGLVSIAGNPRSYGKTYHFSGGESLTIRELAQRLLSHMGAGKPFVSIPLPLVRLASIPAGLIAKLTGKPTLLNWQTVSGIIQDADLDNGEARRDLGYHPRPFSQGIHDLVSLKDCLKKAE